MSNITMLIMRTSAKLVLCLLVLFGSLLASTAHAQIFDVRLGGKALGSLQYRQTADGKTLRTVLLNTPLGVFDGTFQATSQPVQGSSGADIHTFESTSKSSRKMRRITLVIQGGRAVEAVIKPETERTALSDINRVPRGIVDPVYGIGQLITSQGCPKAFTIYDGRRAIRLAPKNVAQSGDVLTCDISYKVIAGPGHLSPLYISTVKMQVTYDLSDGAQDLTRIKMGSGLFNLVLDLKD